MASDDFFEYLKGVDPPSKRMDAVRARIQTDITPTSVCGRTVADISSADSIQWTAAVLLEVHRWMAQVKYSKRTPDAELTRLFVSLGLDRLDPSQGDLICKKLSRRLRQTEGPKLDKLAHFPHRCTDWARADWDGDIKTADDVDAEASGEPNPISPAEDTGRADGDRSLPYPDARDDPDDSRLEAGTRNTASHDPVARPQTRQTSHSRSVRLCNRFDPSSLPSTHASHRPLQAPRSAPLPVSYPKLPRFQEDRQSGQRQAGSSGPTRSYADTNYQPFAGPVPKPIPKPPSASWSRSASPQRVSEPSNIPSILSQLKINVNRIVDDEYTPLHANLAQKVRDLKALRGQSSSEDPKIDEICSQIGYLKLKVSETLERHEAAVRAVEREGLREIGDV